VCPPSHRSPFLVVPEERMPANSSKAKSKRNPAPKTKARRVRSKPFLAEFRAVRIAKPRRRARKGSNGMPPTIPHNPAFMMFGVMGRLVSAYVELPARLAQCRSPMDLWLEQARFAQRICSVCQSTAPSGNSTLRG
jgi:hypothetical protein